jgi:hypothetical protein
VTDRGQSLALVYELRREIRQLSQANERLQIDRTELLAALTRIVSSLEREADDSQCSRSRRPPGRQVARTGCRVGERERETSPRPLGAKSCPAPQTPAWGPVRVSDPGSRHPPGRGSSGCGEVAPVAAARRVLHRAAR